MKSDKNHLRGKSVFTVSLIVVGITFLTVYLTGRSYDRALVANIYLSLTIIATALFLFMGYGLYTGVGLVDNFPPREGYRPGQILSNLGEWGDLSGFDAGEGIGGLLMSIILFVHRVVVRGNLFGGSFGLRMCRQ